MAYDRARLRYPPALYAWLHRRCGLGPGAEVFEIGPGTGIATRRLLRAGAGHLTLIERDPRLARYLRRRFPGRHGRLEVRNAAFESVRLPAGSFDLGVAASSFHWLPRRRALRKVARLLRPGGWWVAWNNHHGDPAHPGAFQRALEPLYAGLHGGRRSIGHSGYSIRQDASDAARQRADLRAVGAFERIEIRDLRWTAVLPPRRVVALWATFSDVATLPPTVRARFLGELQRCLADRFGHRVPLRMVTRIAVARKARPPRGGRGARPTRTNRRR